MRRRRYLLTGTILLALAVGRAAPVPEARADTCASRSDCRTLIGGLRLQSTGWACTSGFLARSTTGNGLYVVTAGHCVADSGLFALWTFHGRTVGHAVVSAFRQASAADVAGIEVAPGSAENRVFGPATGDVRPVTQRAPDAAQIVGSVVCRSGGVSGWRCGRVTRANVPTAIRGVAIRRSWWIDFPSERGDSGSPVLDEDGRIAGIVIATTATESVYSTVDAIEEALGVRPCLDDACG
jgi:streptogrisin B